MVSILLLIFVLNLCHSIADFNSRAWNFSIELIQSTGLDHVAIAPFTVWGLMAGAALWTEGESQEQISKTLILPENKTIFLNEFSNLRRTIFDQQTNGANLDSGIFIFIDNDFVLLPLFKDTMQTYFGAGIITLDFNNTKKAAELADNFIEKKLPRVINVFHAEDFENATMIMSSVISFNGFWKSRFSVLQTTEEVYYRGNETYTVKMMHQRIKLPFSNMESIKADIMELAFGEDGKFCLLLILPHEKSNIKEVYTNLNNITVNDMFDKLQSDVNEFGLKEVDLKLPRLRIQTNIVLNKPLSDIGLNDVFESRQGNFLGITNDDIYISSIEHKTDVTFSESGVYAKATIPGYYDYILGTPKLEAEQPFIFFVMEKPTRTMIFGGLYSKARYV